MDIARFRHPGVSLPAPRPEWLRNKTKRGVKMGLRLLRKAELLLSDSGPLDWGNAQGRIVLEIATEASCAPEQCFLVGKGTARADEFGERGFGHGVGTAMGRHVHQHLIDQGNGEGGTGRRWQEADGFVADGAGADG